MKTPNSNEILEYFQDWDLDDVSRQYIVMHRYRYEFLLDFLCGLISQIETDVVKILDIGESYQTEMLRRLYPDAVVNALGFGDTRFPPRSQDIQYKFDLNNAQYREQWIKTEKHHLIVMAEVLEHLHTSPLHVLRFLLSCLKNGGYLVIQTPNASKLENRLDLLIGKNPYELIREDAMNAGHFREYTLKELLMIGNALGLKCSYYVIQNYFPAFNNKSKICHRISELLPFTFKDGITICFQKNISFDGVNLISENVAGIQRDGFYELEEVNNQMARWTNGNAKINVPIDDQGITNLTINVFEAKGMEFRLLVNGVELERTCLPFGKWLKIYSLAFINFEDYVELSIISGTFVPGKVDATSTDYRTLGIMIAGISLH